MAQLAKLATCVPAFKMFIKRYAYLLFNVKISFFYFFQRKYNLLGYRDLFPIDGGKLKEQPTHSIIPTTPHSACNLLLSVMVGVQGTILRRGAMHHSSHSQSQSQSPSLQLVELIRVELKCHILSLHFRYHISRSHLHITFAKYDKIYNAKSLTCNFIEF